MTRRSKSTGINLFNVAQSAVIAQATTKGLFGTDLLPFLTGRYTDGRFIPGADGYSYITLPELLGFKSNGWSIANIGGNYGSKTFMDAIKYNFDNNGATMVATLLIAPAAFKIAGKLTAKPRRDMNKLLDMAGLKSVVKV